MLTCHCSSSSSLPWSSESSVLGFGSLQLRLSGTHVSRGKSRSRLVDQPPLLSDVPSRPTTNSISHTTNRCFDNRLGSLLSGNKSENRRSIVRARSCSPHQLAGAKSSVSSSSVLCEAKQLPHFGQQSRHLLH